MSEKEKPKLKDDWIICNGIPSPAYKAKLEELLLLVGAELKEFSPSENGKNSSFIHIYGPEPIIKGLKEILSHGIPY